MTLFVCRSCEHLPLLSAHAHAPTGRHIVASDDPEVHRRARQIDWVTDVCWLEEMESLYEVCEDVRAIVDAVNGWSASLAGPSQTDRDLLTWLRNVEADNPAERIQDALLLIRSYLALLARYHVSSIVVVSGPGAPRWEDLVLREVARSLHVEYSVVGPPLSLGARMTERLRRIVKPIAALPARIWRTSNQIRHIVKTSKQMPAVALDANPDVLVAFQLCSRSEAHLENVGTLMTALARRGRRSLALTCFVPAAAERARRDGLEAVELGRFVSLGSIARAGWDAFRLSLVARMNRSRLVNRPELTYRGVGLGPLIARTFHNFLVSRFLVRAVMSRALTQFLGEVRPAALKLWGGTNLDEGYLAWKAVTAGRAVPPPLLFDYEIGLGPEWPYQPDEQPYLLLVPGEIRKRMVDKVFPPERLVAVGSSRYGGLAEWRRQNDPRACRRALNIAPGFDLHVFFDPSAVARGMLTAREQSVLSDTLLQFAASHPACALIVKPHPTHARGPLENLIQARATANVFYVPPEHLPYQAMNAADVVITKFSTIAIEAMLLRRPVISVVLDGEHRWNRIFEDAVERVFSTAELTQLLNGLLCDAERRLDWMTNQLERQTDYLHDYFEHQAADAPAAAADAIQARIGKIDAVSMLTVA